MIWTLPFFAILLFTVMTDSVQSDWPRTVFRAAASLLCAAYIVVGARKGSVRIHWLLIPSALIAVWGLLQLGLDSTVWHYATWRAALQWIACLALFFAAMQCVALRFNLQLAAWFGGLYSFYALIHYGTSSASGERMSATFLNHNHYAALMELLFPVALWRISRERRKVIFVLCAAVMFVSVAIVGSRAGIVLLFLELVYLGLRTTPKPLYVLSGAVLVAALAAGLMWTRFRALSTNGPYDSRGATARASLKMIRARPLLGFGLGTWANVYPAYAQQDTGFRLIHADDDWLEWTAEGGVPFTLFLLALAAFAIASAWREPWCVGCVAVMLHSLTEFPLQKQAIWAWLVVLLAVAQPSKQKAVRQE
jgi:O-antigen ligase